MAAVFVAEEDVLSPVATQHHMIHATWHVNSRLAGQPKKGSASPLSMQDWKPDPIPDPIPVRIGRGPRRVRGGANGAWDAPFPDAGPETPVVLWTHQRKG